MLAHAFYPLLLLAERNVGVEAGAQADILSCEATERKEGRKEQNTRFGDSLLTLN